jgi:hypothetical protein
MKLVFTKRLLVVVLAGSFVCLSPFRSYAPPFISPYDYNPNPYEIDISAHSVAYQDGHVLNSLALLDYSGEPSTSGLASPPDPGNNGAFTANSFFDVFTEITLDGNSYTANGVGSLSDSSSSDALPNSSGFNTEWTTLLISGGTLPVGVEIRESTNSTLQAQSVGQTTEQDIGGGQYQITSFFDIFTEISLDGGATWSTANGALDLTSTPEPSEVALFSAGGIALIAAARRRRQGRQHK